MVQAHKMEDILALGFEPCGSIGHEPLPLSCAHCVGRR